MKCIIETLKTKYPGIKIILSEITPRKDEKDETVKEYNNLLCNLYEKEPNIFIVYHKNLRDDNYSKHYDEKHIHKRAIPLFASNIKRALRNAYGIKFDKIKPSNKNQVHNLDPNSPYYLHTLKKCLNALPVSKRRQVIS